MQFQLQAPFKARGDQPKVIRELSQWLSHGNRFQTLKGVTGSGKTFMLANVIQNVQKPTLVISHNKTLASQLYQEFRAFFPTNGVHYFVSYYDYYQPEAYIAPSDTYIEKDAKINDEIDRLRHGATQALFMRKDVIIVASVSCIYNIGSPEEYEHVAMTIGQGQRTSRKEFISNLVKLQYERSDFALLPGTFRVRGDTIDVFLPAGGEVITVEFFGDEIEQIFLRRFNRISELFDNTTKQNTYRADSIKLFPAKHFVTPQEQLELALENINLELEEREAYFKKHGKYLEAQRIRERTRFDLEMIRETGSCNGIENYSRHLEFRTPGDPPHTLLDYFPEDFLLIVDESHITLPQFRGMYEGDHSRKQTLVDYGFRLPSAVDNRPLRFPEFEHFFHQVIFSSATPGPYELEHSRVHVSEAIVRPTGLLDPAVEIRKTQNQLDDIMKEVKVRAKRNERSLILTLTKRHAEDLADYLENKGLNVLYLHSEIKTLERPEILYKLRKGDIDAIIGINLLREGIDLPEVSLVAILDADKEGFLRNETSFIQMFGRAARHVNGTVFLYTDTITGSMKRAMFETERRRRIQREYNATHHITPQGIRKDIIPVEIVGKKKASLIDTKGQTKESLEKAMWEASKNLQFEKAALLRDKLKEFTRNEKI